MARKHSTLAVKHRAIRQSVPSPQCEGINRRGMRCGCRVSASTRSGNPATPGSSKYCKTHLRILLNSQAPLRLPQPGARQRYQGLYIDSTRSMGSFRLPANIPAWVSALVATEICDDLVKGASPSDEAGHIYAWKSGGICSVLCAHRTDRDICQIRLGPT